MIGYISGQGTPWSYDQLQQKRRIAESLMTGMRPARNVGEGLAAIGQALAIRGINRRADREEARMKSEADSIWSGISGGMTSGTFAPASYSAPQTPGQAVADDTMAALGYGSALPASLIQNESGGSFSAKNDVPGSGGVGHFGRGQFSIGRMADAKRAGVIPADMTPDQFLANPQAQAAVEQWHVQDINGFIQRNGLDQYIGQSINGVPVTPEGMLAVAHLGGSEGLRKFLQTGGQYNPSDANGTSLMDYFSRHGGAAPAQQPQIAQLLAAASNPMIMNDPGRRAVVEALLGRAMEQPDPMEQRRQELEMAKLEAEIANMAQGGDRETQFVDGIGLIDKNTGEVISSVADMREGQEPAPDVKAETDLRKEYNATPSVKSFQEQTAAMGRVLASAERANTEASPAADIALIFNYMKVLDPGSTVREGEFATAAQAGSFGQQIQAVITKLNQGEILTPEQRADFVNRAGRLYEQGRRQYADVYGDYREIAGDYGLDVNRSVPNYQPTAPMVSPRPQRRTPAVNRAAGNLITPEVAAPPSVTPEAIAAMPPEQVYALAEGDISAMPQEVIDAIEARLQQIVNEGQ